MTTEIEWIYPINGASIEWIYPWRSLGASGYSFGTVTPDGGSNPIATTSGDTLKMTSSDSSISVIGNIVTNSIDLKVASASNTADYKEFAYLAGDLSTITVYDDITKALKLFTKTFTYSGGDLNTLAIYDEIALSTLTKTFHYDVGGDLDYINEVIT